MQEYDADTQPCQKGQTTLPIQTWQRDKSSFIPVALNLMVRCVEPQRKKRKKERNSLV
jgi:hypothetical protein